MTGTRLAKRPSKVRRSLTAGLRRHRTHLPPAAPSTLPEVTPQAMTQEMVDRLFWRAGFGPSAEDRATWTGRSVEEAVDWLLSTPEGALVGPEPKRDGNPLDPMGDDIDLALSWIDRMIRTRNPLAERLAFFWHRHWANSRQEVSPPQLLLTQNSLFRRYADLGANAGADFRNLAYEVTEDPSMLRFLTGETNVKGDPNENYARELMELFCLGPLDDKGAPNYSEEDVKQLAKALTGWQIDDSNPDAVRSFFTVSRWYNGPKVVFGKYGNFKTRDAVDLVLAHPAHPAFLVRKLWHEFVASPPDAATLADLTATYTQSSLALKPLLRKILTHQALFESLDEPNMVKPPIVYLVGAMRALGIGVTGTGPADYLNGMGQLPYFPPTVAGWEGGLSWLNSNTALVRFSFIAELLNDAAIMPEDVFGETASAAFDRAYAAVGSPWLAPGTRAAIQDYAARASSKTSQRRVARQFMLRALLLAGPDAQVM